MPYRLSVDCAKFVRMTIFVGKKHILQQKWSFGIFGGGVECRVGRHREYGTQGLADQRPVPEAEQTTNTVAGDQNLQGISSESWTPIEIKDSQKCGDPGQDGETWILTEKL